MNQPVDIMRCNRVFFQCSTEDVKMSPENRTFLLKSIIFRFHSLVLPGVYSIQTLWLADGRKGVALMRLLRYIEKRSHHQKRFVALHVTVCVDHFET